MPKVSRLTKMGNHLTIIAAGGVGRRFGQRKPKLLYPLVGKPIIQWTVESVCASTTSGIVLVAPMLWVDEFSAIVQNVSCKKIISVIPGGKTRTESVIAGLETMSAFAEDDDIVIVHDGARPFVSPELFAECADRAREFGAAVVAIPVIDTIKIVEGGFVVSTPDRSKLWAAQTPQAFRYAVIKSALSSKEKFTDDATAVELIGHQVCVIEGKRENIKITTMDDIALAETIIRMRFSGLN